MKNDFRSKQNIPPDPERRKEDREHDRTVLLFYAVVAGTLLTAGAVVGYSIAKRR